MALATKLLQLLLGTFFTGAAAFKLVRHPHMTKEFASLRVPYVWALAFGAVEIIAGSGLIAGLWWPAVAVGAALFMACVMGGGLCQFLATRPEIWLGRGGSDARLSLGRLVSLACARLKQTGLGLD